MPKIIQKNRQQLISFILTIIMMIFFSETLYATIPEPETQISGQVYNLYQNHKVLITEAQVEWTMIKSLEPVIIWRYLLWEISIHSTQVDFALQMRQTRFIVIKRL